MKITFHPYDFEYKVKNGEVLVYLYSKRTDGEKICVVQKHRPYFFAELKNIDQSEFTKRLQTLSLEAKPEPARIISFEIVTKELLGKEQSFYKIYANYPKAVPLLAKEIQSWGVECYEKDILFIHRYLRDTGIVPMMETEAEGAYLPATSLNIPLFAASSIKQKSSNTFPSWKILSFDIETYSERKEIDPKRNPILMIAFYGIDSHGQEIKEVITWKKFAHEQDYINFVQDEKALLEKARDFITTYQPDIITGYFSDGFDFPYINSRAEQLKIPFEIGIDGSTLIASTKPDFRDGESKVRGILHIDVLKFVKYIFGKNLKTDSYSLDNVASELLGHQKHLVDLDSLPNIWDTQPELLEQFCNYNLHDARLTYNLCQKLLFDMIEFSKIVGLPLFDVIRMRFSRLVESYILKRAMEFNVIAPNKPGNTEVDQRLEESIEGGFVYEPIPGLYKDIVVFDFRSLYPTIIVSHNIGPEGLRREPCQDKITVPDKEEYWFCQDRRYFLPLVLEDLISRRLEVKKQIKQASAEEKNFLEARSYALKILANSFYGYLGFFGARWYSLECAGSTTAFARHYIKQTIQKAQEQGFTVLYGDTDSCFFQLSGKTIDDALNFMREINTELPGQMELEFEGYFPQGIFVAIKGSEKGAKKKYALIREDQSLKVTGFEAVRRNWSPLAKEVQQKVLSLVLSDKLLGAVQYVKSIVKDLKTGNIPLTKLIIKTQITREISQYTSIGPHVLMAMKMMQKGERILPGTVVEYVIAKGPGLVRERAKLISEMKEGEYDQEYYLHNQLIPAVAPIFSVLGYQEDEIFAETTQMGLGKFF